MVLEENCTRNYLKGQKEKETGYLCHCTQNQKIDDAERMKNKNVKSFHFKIINVNVLSVIVIVIQKN